MLINKIKMIIEYCGAMPTSMIYGFVLLALCIAAAVVILKLKGGGSK